MRHHHRVIHQPRHLAEVCGDQVVVWSEAVPHPTAVRYAWQPYTDANLVNADELPASTFTSETDKS